jgi:hypothetical protein
MASKGSRGPNRLTDYDIVFLKACRIDPEVSLVDMSVGILLDRCPRCDCYTCVCKKIKNNDHESDGA